MLLSIEQRLAKLLNSELYQIQNTIKLLDDGATVPFIARYRKEITGGLNDQQLRELAEKLIYLRELDERRNVILRSINEQNKLTHKLEELILQAENKTTLEDLYLPFKPKRRTKSQIAKEAGLEPLALLILEQQNIEPTEHAINFINIDKQINNTQDAIDGARYIILDFFAENATLLAKLRQKLTNESLIFSNVIDGKQDQGVKFSDYFEYSELFSSIPSHRALAILRGNNEEILKIGLTYPEQQSLSKSELSSFENLIVQEFNIISSTNSWLSDTVKLAWRAKIFPSLENELLSLMREKSEDEAIKVFATNLHNLLLQAPAGCKNTLGLDPGIRTGVKIAVIDNTGKLLTTNTIYPFTRNRQEAISILAKICLDFKVELISIGNGTASRETEQLARELCLTYPAIKAQIVIVSEAGASVYSASEFASQEFPNLDVSLRGAVSIARRLQDPLAELVKIEPKAIGVGQYQHDVNQNKLAQSLNNVIEDCVNAVGVEINTASIPLLAKVSGLNNVIATNIVNYRNNYGKFTNRNQLMNVPRLGVKTFEQCAGFLRINQGDNVLDQSAVHPESYQLVQKIANQLNIEIEQLIGNSQLLNSVKLNELIDKNYGLPTILDIIKELEKPGRDPRGEFIMAKFKEGVNHIHDLHIGMELEGVITNVANFGAFVDIGVHQDGLVHISEIADQYISNPNQVLKVGQIVKVRIEELDTKRNRISLTMKGLNKLNLANNSPKLNKVNKIKTVTSIQNSSNSTMSLAFAKIKRI